jgi:hypothetical protein
MPFDFDGLRQQRFSLGVRRRPNLAPASRPADGTPAFRPDLAPALPLSGRGAWDGSATWSESPSGRSVPPHHPSDLLLTATWSCSGKLAGVVIVPTLPPSQWALEVRLGSPLATSSRWRDVSFAMIVMLALGWTVAHACLRRPSRNARSFFSRRSRNRHRACAGPWSPPPRSRCWSRSSAISRHRSILGPRPLSWLVVTLLGWQAVTSAAPLGQRALPGRPAYPGSEPVQPLAAERG